MSRYTAAMDVWRLSETERAALQPGQWVYAGDRSNIGRYMGQRSSGSDVVAWCRPGGGFMARMRALRDYAIGDGKS